mmetsp:Transcript_30085/g.75938  ORF Transcript_30085/g.75938 Transcript_30085/m.75938 type:complete len:278 (-) Transcript_30085:1011-1844(-)
MEPEETDLVGILDQIATLSVDVDRVLLAHPAIDARRIEAASSLELVARDLLGGCLVRHQEVPQPRAKAPKLTATLEEGLQGPGRLALEVKWGAQRVDVGVHVHTTDVAPILTEIFPLHPIGAIVALLKLQLLLNVGVLIPLRAVIRPRSRPLACAPWIAHLHEAEILFGLPILPHGADLEQGESMLLHQALCLASRLDTAAAQHGPMSVVVPQQFEQLTRTVALLCGPEAAGSLVARVVHDDEVIALPDIAVGDLVAPCVAARHANDAPLSDTRLDG